MKPLESKGECEACEKMDVVITLHYGNMWFCNECWDREVKVTTENQSAEKQAERVAKVNDVVIKAKKIDSTVELREDIYNAETTSIVDIQKAVMEDETIENKKYAIAELVVERLRQHSKLIFDKRQEIAELQMRERASQSILNNLASNLHAEEREKLKLKDTAYKPVAPKKIKHKEPTVGAKKFNLTELKKYAEQYGLSTAAIQSVVHARKVTVEQAAKILSEL